MWLISYPSSLTLAQQCAKHRCTASEAVTRGFSHPNSNSFPTRTFQARQKASKHCWKTSKLNYCSSSSTAIYNTPSNKQHRIPQSTITREFILGTLLCQSPQNTKSIDTNLSKHYTSTAPNTAKNIVQHSPLPPTVPLLQHNPPTITHRKQSNFSATVHSVNGQPNPPPPPASPAAIARSSQDRNAVSAAPSRTCAFRSPWSRLVGRSIGRREGRGQRQQANKRFALSLLYDMLVCCGT